MSVWDMPRYRELVTTGLGGRMRNDGYNFRNFHEIHCDLLYRLYWW